MKTLFKNYVICMICAIGCISQAAAQIATIPFTSEGLMYVKVKINDHKEPLNFVFDTGASTVVLDEKVAERIGVKANYQQPTTGASGTEMYNIALSQKFQIGDIVLKDAHTVLVDLERLSKRGNFQIDGIIGANVMKEYVTQIDFDAEVLRLYKSVEDISEQSGYTALDVEIDYATIPEINLEFTLDTNQKFSGNFLFDSGANMTFLLNTPFAKEKNIENLLSKTIETKAESLTTSSNFKIGKVASAQLADFMFDEMPMDISNSTSGVMASKEYAGILGIKIISRFNCILDYANAKIYLKPNKTYEDAFEFPRSGIALSREKNMIKITNVIADTEAHEKGVRKGDQLLEIDGVAADNIGKCKELLKQKDKTVQLKLKDEKGAVKVVSILLKRLI
ncbi:MAG: aspartyl protease family protein [Bacteroidota bacterium]